MPPVVAEHHHGPAAGNSLARVVGPVLHQLLGRDVERHRHRAPPGLSRRSATICSTTPASCSSGRNRSPWRVDEGERRPDPAAEVRAAGGGVVVGGVVQRLDATRTAAVGVHARAPQLLHRPPREERAGPDAVVVVLLVAATGHVVGEDPADVARQVEAGEERHDRQALHGQAEVAADHRREPVGLALQREQRALDLLVVLELDLEELDQLDRDAGGPGDADGGVLVGAEHLLACRGWR